MKHLFYNAHNKRKANNFKIINSFFILIETNNFFVSRVILPYEKNELFISFYSVQISIYNVQYI